MSSILPTSAGIVLFNSSGSRSSAPTCQGSGNSQRWAIDMTNAAGQAKMATLLTAYSLHKEVFVLGTGTCSGWPDTETRDNFFIVDAP